MIILGFAGWIFEQCEINPSGQLTESQLFSVLILRKLHLIYSFLLAGIHAVDADEDRVHRVLPLPGAGRTGRIVYTKMYVRA